MIPDRNTTRALVNLSGNPEFQAVLAFLQTTLGERMDDLMRHTNLATVHQTQGYAQALKDFLQAARTAKPSPAHLG